MSETGTYIIETDDNNNSNKNNKLNVNTFGSYNNDTEFEIRTKAINQAFGINFDIEDLNNSSKMVKEPVVVTVDELTPRNSVGNKNLKIFSSSNSTSPSLNSSVSSTESEHTNTGDNNKDCVRSRITKTLTYDVLAGDHNDATVACSESVNTNLLLGDTENLIIKLTERNKEFEALSTRATVNASHVFKEPSTNLNRKHNGGLSFSVDLDLDNENSLNSSMSSGNIRIKQKLKPKAAITTQQDQQQQIIKDLCNQPTKKLDLYKSRASNDTVTASITTASSDFETMKSVNTEMSLGTRIQNLTKPTESFHRRSSISSEKEFKPISVAPAVPTSMITNRTLLLRQQSAKAKRESSVNSANRSTFNNSIATKSTTPSSNKDRVPLSDRASTARSSSKAPKNASSESRSSSPSVQSSANQHTPAKDAFSRRKTYDPVKAVEDARIKQKLKQTNGNLSSRGGKNPVKTSDLDDNDDCSFSSSMDLVAPLEKLKSNIAANKQVNFIFK